MEQGVVLTGYSTLDRKKMKAPAPPPPKSTLSEIDKTTAKDITLSEHHAIVYTYDDKNWKPICDKYILITFIDSGGMELNDRYSLNAFMDSKKVLQYNIIPSTKVKLKDSFVRCQNEKMIVGARFKKKEAAVKYQQQLSEIIAELTPYAKVNKIMAVNDRKGSPTLSNVSPALSHKRNESISSGSSQEPKDTPMLPELDNAIWKPFLSLANLQNEELANIQISAIVKKFVLERGGEQFLRRVDDQKMSPQLVDDLNDLAGQVHAIIELLPAQNTPPAMISQTSMSTDNVSSSSLGAQQNTVNGIDSSTTLDRKAMKNKRRAPPPPMRKTKSLQNLLDSETVYCEISQFQDGGMEMRSNSVSSRPVSPPENITSPGGKRKAPAAPSSVQLSRKKSLTSSIGTDVPSDISAPVTPLHEINVEIKSDTTTTIDEKRLPLFIPPPPPDGPPPEESIGSPAGPLSPETTALLSKDGQLPLAKSSNTNESLKGNVIDEQCALAELDKAISSEEISVDPATATLSNQSSTKHLKKVDTVDEKKHATGVVLTSDLLVNGEINAALEQGLKEQKVGENMETEATTLSLHENMAKIKQEINQGSNDSSLQTQNSLQQQLLALQEQVLQQQQMLLAAGILSQDGDKGVTQQKTDSVEAKMEDTVADVPPIKSVEISPPHSETSKQVDMKESKVDMPMHLEEPTEPQKVLANTPKGIEKSLEENASNVSNGVHNVQKSAVVAEKTIEIEVETNVSDNISKNIGKPVEKVNLDKPVTESFVTTEADHDKFPRSTVIETERNLSLQSNLTSSISKPSEAVNSEILSTLESHVLLTSTKTESDTDEVDSHITADIKSTAPSSSNVLDKTETIKSTVVTSVDSSSISSSSTEENSVSKQQSDIPQSIADAPLKSSSSYSGLPKKPTSGLYAKLKAKTAAKSKAQIKTPEPGKTSPTSLLKQYDFVISKDQPITKVSTAAVSEAKISESKSSEITSQSSCTTQKVEATVSKDPNLNVDSRFIQSPIDAPVETKNENLIISSNDSIAAIKCNDLTVPNVTVAEDVSDSTVSLTNVAPDESKIDNVVSISNNRQINDVDVTKTPIEINESKIEDSLDAQSGMTFADVESASLIKEETNLSDASNKKSVEIQERKTSKPILEEKARVIMRTSVTDNFTAPDSASENKSGMDDRKIINSIQNKIICDEPTNMRGRSSSEQLKKAPPIVRAKPIRQKSTESTKENVNLNNANIAITAQTKPVVKPKPTALSNPSTFMRAVSEEPGSRQNTTTKTVGALTFGFARDTTRSASVSSANHIKPKEPPKILPKTAKLNREFSTDSNIRHSAVPSEPRKSIKDELVQDDTKMAASIDIDLRSHAALKENP